MEPLDPRIPGAERITILQGMRTAAANAAGTFCLNDSVSPSSVKAVGANIFSGDSRLYYNFGTPYRYHTNISPPLREDFVTGLAFDGTQATAADRSRGSLLGVAPNLSFGTVGTALSSDLNALYVGEFISRTNLARGDIFFYLALPDEALSQAELDRWTVETSAIASLFRGPRVFVRAFDVGAGADRSVNVSGVVDASIATPNPVVTRGADRSVSVSGVVDAVIATPNPVVSRGSDRSVSVSGVVDVGIATPNPVVSRGSNRDVSVSGVVALAIASPNPVVTRETPSVGQTIWYVHAPDGGSAGSGTIGDPWNGWANINWSSVTSGDILDLLGETHVGSGPFYFEKPVEVRNGVVDADGQVSGFVFLFRNLAGTVQYPITLRSLTIHNGNAGVQTYTGSLLDTTVTSNQILNCVIKDMTTSHGLDHRGSGLLLSGCHFDNIGIDAIRAEGQSITIKDCVIEGYSVAGADGDAIQFTDYASGSVISGNYILHEHANKQGILVDAGLEPTGEYEISGNILVCNVVTPTLGQSGIRPGARARVYSNYVTGFYDGIFVGTSSDQALVTGNIAHDCDRSGVLIAGTDNFVANNTLADSAIGVYTFAGATHEVQNNWIVNNTIGLELFNDSDVHDYNIYSGNSSDIENASVPKGLAANERTNSDLLVPTLSVPSKPIVMELAGGGCSIDWSGTAIPLYDSVQSIVRAGLYDSRVKDVSGDSVRDGATDVGAQQFALSRGSWATSQSRLRRLASLREDDEEVAAILGALMDD